MQSALLALTFLSRIELKGKEQFGKIYRHFQSCVAFHEVIPCPQSVELTQVVFDKANLEKVKYRKDKKIAPEGYELQIKKNGVVIRYSTSAGRFYAEQTLAQLADDDVMYCGTIKDEPRYAWRGLMLDESRHFFGKEQVLKFLDLMGRYKLNRFHWHLSLMNRSAILLFPFLLQKSALAFNHLPLSFSMESAKGTV